MEAKRLVEFITMAPTAGDGAFIGAKNKKIGGRSVVDETAEREPTLEYIKAIAQAAEQGGFSSLLLPTGTNCLDSLAVAANLINHTETLNFLFAVRPGSMAPATFAKQFATVHYWSGGRALVNIVTGGSPTELASQGDFFDHRARYERTREYIQVLNKFFTEDVFTHHGEHFQLENASLYPKLASKPPIYFGGSSDIALDVAAAEADVYMLWGETLELSAERLSEIKKRAAATGRQLSYSISFQVVLGDTEKEAYEKANSIVSKSQQAALEEKNNLAYKGESVGVKQLHDLMENSKDKNFHIGPNIWAGLTQVLSGNSIALVGTPDQVSERIIEFVDLGFDKVLLRGFPHLETIKEVGELVIPKVREKLAQRQTIK